MYTMETTRLVLSMILLNFLPENYINVHNVGNVFHCAFQCMYDVSCLSVVYNTVSGSCYLYNQTIWSNATGVADAKFVMYNTDRAMKKHVKSCAASLGYVLDEALDFCYKLHSEVLTNPAADAACKSEGGMGLANLDTLDKVNLFMAIIPEYQYSHVNGYLEGSDWVYPAETSADATPYLQWKPGQPNGASSTQHCLAVDGGGISDAYCDSRAEFPFICEL